MGDYELPTQESLAEFVKSRGCSILPGHGVLLYEKIRGIGRIKLGDTWHERYDWQAAVDKHLGKS
jgi:hypothetical protein